MAANALLVLPTYNERDNLEPFVHAVCAVLPDIHVLVIDDGSPDGTGELADRLAREDARVRVWHRPSKLGLGTAYRGGFQRALSGQYQRIFQMDADFSHDPADLLRLLRAADDGADVAIGSRYVAGGGTRNWSLRRRILSRGGSFYARTILGVGVRDLTAGFKCWRREALQRIELDSVRSEGYGFQIEMTYRAIRQGLQVVEVPILFTERRAGSSKMSGGIITEAIIGVWRLRARV